MTPTAQAIFNRLTMVEQLTLRRATPGGIDHLANTDYLVDMPLEEPANRAAILTEVLNAVNQRHRALADLPYFGPPREPLQ